jgi:hypothetical protein
MGLHHRSDSHVLTIRYQAKNEEWNPSMIPAFPDTLQHLFPGFPSSVFEHFHASDCLQAIKWSKRPQSIQAFWSLVSLTLNDLSKMI